MKPSLLLAAVGLISATIHSAGAEEITIGAPMSLTGVYAFVGTSAVKGMQLAFDEINAGNELGAGRTIKLIVADDGSNTNQAITLVNRMATVDKVMAIAGPSASPTVLAASPVANQLQIPLLGIAVTPAVNKAGIWSNRILNSPATLMTVLSNYTLAAYKPKTVMTVASRDNDGAAAQAKVVRSVMEGKVTLLPEESAMMAETDFSALSTKIASLKPDVVMITMNDSAAANIILQARQAGVDPKVHFVANNAAASASFLRIGGKAVEGVLVGTDAFPEVRTDPMAKTFVANFQKKYNAIPDQWGAVGYTIGRLYGNAIAKAKTPLSRQTLLDALLATRDFPVLMGSGKGNFSFTPGEREPSYDPILTVVKDGKFTPAP